MNPANDPNEPMNEFMGSLASATARPSLCEESLRGV